MATIRPKTNFVQHSVVQTVWVMGGADTGLPEELSRFPFHSATIAGTFGGATALLEGSDDGVNYFTLTGENPAGGSDVIVSTTSANRFDFNNVPQYIRPRTTGGTGSDLTITLISRSYGH